MATLADIDLGAGGASRNIINRINGMGVPGDGTSGVANVSGYGGGQASAGSGISSLDQQAAIAEAARRANIQRQANPLLASLGSLDAILNNRNQQSRDEYGRAIAGYDETDALDRQAYNRSIAQNESTLTKNNQAALLNAANASTGLRGVLSSLGALAGSGQETVGRLTGLAANTDAGNARETFETNATGLNDSWGRAEREQRQRRMDAKAALDNNLLNNESGVLSSRQSILQQLAQTYGTDDAQGQAYANQAASLAAPIARTTRASVAPYAKASSSFTPGALQEYLAGTQDLGVTASSGGSTTPINSPLFSSQRKKDSLMGVA